MKRALDLLVAVLLIVPAALVVLVAAIFVRLDSPGPAIFRQERVGRYGRPFLLLKVRTMRAGTVNSASHEVSAASITRVGVLLRRTKVDELPQLLCVLTGTMSLVGPRPCLPSQYELIAARRRRGVLNVRPGVTGLAQLYGIDMSRPERLANVDAIYVRNRTLIMDLRLLVGTVLGRGRGDAVAGLSQGIEI